MECERQFSRFGIADSCRDIAIRAYLRTQLYMESRPPDPDFRDEEEFGFWVFLMRGIDRRIAEETYIVIVFVGIFVEAYIYDYAARFLGDNYVQNNLDSSRPETPYRLEMCTL